MGKLGAIIGVILFVVLFWDDIVRGGSFYLFASVLGGVIFGGIIGKLLGIIMKVFSNIGSNPLGLCNSCQGIQLEGMTVRGLVNSEVFNEFDGKTVLIFHLFDRNGCQSCKEKAKNHLQDFVNTRGLNFDVDRYYNSVRNR